MEIRTIVVGQLAANCYLVIDESTRAAAVIDPGDNPDEVADTIRGANVGLKHILLTHGHPDHSFTIGDLQERFKVDLLMHEADVPQLDGEPDLVSIFYDLSTYIQPKFGKFLVDGDTITLGETKLEVINTPGHSPGGVCYYAGDALFTGDTLFAGSIGRTDLRGGSFDMLMRSIHEKLFTLPDDTVIYPGHGPKSTIGREKKENPWV